MTVFATLLIYNPKKKVNKKMTNNVRLTFSVGETASGFSIILNKTIRIGDTKYNIEYSCISFASNYHIFVCILFMRGCCAMCHASLTHIVHSPNTVTLVVAKAPLPHVLTYQHRESSNLKATNVLLTYY